MNNNTINNNKKETSKNIIPIFFTTDDNYIPFLTVSIYSLIKNSSIKNYYKIYILNTGLSQSSIKSINNLKRPHVEFNFVNVTDRVNYISNELHTRDYYSKTTYFRLFIPNMFPEYDKALYLDSDIVLLDDVAKLYNTDIKDNLVGAIPDEAVQVVPEFICYVNNYLGIQKQNYFNAGILVMNLKELRDYNFEDNFVNLLKLVKFEVAQDQDYLNTLCKNRVHYISPVWNKMPIPSKEINDIDIKLIHYNLSFKPWKYDNILYQDYFWNFAKECGMYESIYEIKQSFTQADKERDTLGGENLKRLALEKSHCETFSFTAINKKSIVNG